MWYKHNLCKTYTLANLNVPYDQRKNINKIYLWKRTVFMDSKAKTNHRSKSEININKIKSIRSYKCWKMKQIHVCMLELMNKLNVNEDSFKNQVKQGQ
jgi:hypothetical protein